MSLTRRLQPLTSTGALVKDARPTSRDFGADARPAIAAAVKDAFAISVNADKLTSVGLPESSNDGGYTGYAIPALTEKGKGKTARRTTPGTARARKTWFATPGGLVPAYYVELNLGWAGGAAEVRSFVVSAAGAVRFRSDLTTPPVIPSAGPGSPRRLAEPQVHGNAQLRHARHQLLDHPGIKSRQQLRRREQSQPLQRLPQRVRRPLLLDRPPEPRLEAPHVPEHPLPQPLSASPATSPGRRPWPSRSRRRHGTLTSAEEDLRQGPARRLRLRRLTAVNTSPDRCSKTQQRS